MDLILSDQILTKFQMIFLTFLAKFAFANFVEVASIFKFIQHLISRELGGGASDAEGLLFLEPFEAGSTVLPLAMVYNSVNIEH